jgi:A/G-specific adenine glycosylase
LSFLCLENKGDFSDALQRWYLVNQRDLPWRKRPGGYRIWISEIMAQQTRMETVVGYYRRFVKRFPSLLSLAQAPLDDVLALWSGLGYYGRARHLHKAARLVLAQHKGRLPRDVPALKKLPGIGDYTASAIASMAYGKAVAVMDGNVMRVYSRLADLDGDIRLGKTQRSIKVLAQEVLDESRPGDFNQALMELGALVCTPTSPRCEGCPVKDFCQARREDSVHLRPLKSLAQAPRKVKLQVGVLRRASDGAVLLIKNPPHGLFGGLWSLPMYPQDGDPKKLSNKKAFENSLLDMFGTRFCLKRPVLKLTHVLSHRLLDVRVFELLLGTEAIKASCSSQILWLGKDDPLSALGLSSLTKGLLLSDITTRF